MKALLIVLCLACGACAGIRPAGSCYVVSPDSWGGRTKHGEDRRVARQALEGLANTLEVEGLSARNAASRMMFPCIEGPDLWDLPDGRILAGFSVGADALYLIVFSKESPHVVIKQGFVSHRTLTKLDESDCHRWDRLLKAAE